jgi:hypothetical protein
MSSAYYSMDYCREWAKVRSLSGSPVDRVPCITESERAQQIDLDRMSFELPTAFEVTLNGLKSSSYGKMSLSSFRHGPGRFSS